MSEKTKSTIERLEEEGELAADYLEELLDIADLDGDIEIDVENDRASVEIISEESGTLERLVGEDGEVLDALQELTRLAVQTETGERSRLMLDIAGFRADRKAELQDIAMEAIARLRATGVAQKLDPMNPFERKVCHDVVATEGLRSESEGSEPHRCVVILPADESDQIEESDAE
ncbi:MAG: Jag family protein [Schaalia turicensis]